MCVYHPPCLRIHILPAQYLVKIFHHSTGIVPPTGVYPDVTKVDLSKQHWIGDVRFTLSRLMCARSQKLSCQFTNGQK
jgi:hypothetical protein